MGSEMCIRDSMDTVEPGRGIIPVVDKDTIYSKEDTILGGDCKAGLTGILEALDSLHESNHELKNLTLIFTREEEVALLGARHLDFSQILGEKAIIFDGEGPPSIITNSSPTYGSPIYWAVSYTHLTLPTNREV